MSDQRKRLGVALLGLRPCGRVGGLMWTDAFAPSVINKAAREWLALGWTVSRVERFEGDPMPEFGWCDKGEPCACREGKR